MRPRSARSPMASSCALMDARTWYGVARCCSGRPQATQESVVRTIRESLWAQRLSAGLLTVFGGLALLLANIGIYGVISYSVTQRRREIGVRMALGATAGDVQIMILGEGVRLVAIGVLVGVTIAMAVSRAIQSMLFETSARDRATFVLVPSILTLVAILACWVPARRATRIDPSTALRDE